PLYSAVARCAIYTVSSFHPGSLALRVLPSFPTRRSSDLSFLFGVAPAYAASGDNAAAALGEGRRSGTAGAATRRVRAAPAVPDRSEEHTSELQSRGHLVCRLLLEKKNTSQHNDGAAHTNT